MSAIDPVAVGAELERLIGKLSSPDVPASAAQAQALLRLVMSLYGAGLARILDIVRSGAASAELIDRLARDPLVASLFDLHDLHPQADARPKLIQILRPTAPLAVPPKPTHSHEATHCEVCRAPLSDAHRHVVDVQTRRLLCTCSTCGENGGRYRPVPDRYVHGASMTLSSAQWDALEIPVGLVFLFFNSHLGRMIACYPGPAGATESLLPLDAWRALAGGNPWIDELAPDVEALLVRRVGEEYRCFIVPIDACYELVGRIRQTWVGIGGGDQAARVIDAFFDTVSGKSGAFTASAMDTSPSAQP